MEQREGRGVTGKGSVWAEGGEDRRVMAVGPGRGDWWIGAWERARKNWVWE